LIHKITYGWYENPRFVLQNADFFSNNSMEIRKNAELHEKMTKLFHIY